MTCDCIRMQQLLQKSNNETSDIMETFKAISAFEEQPEDSNEHYFEVRLLGVPQESGLLDEDDVIRYLSETAPIDFDSQQFPQARKIRDHFSEKGFPITCYKILRGARKKPIYKLYSRSLSTGKQGRTKAKDYVRDVEFIYKEASDGKPLYIGWLAITDFLVLFLMNLFRASVFERVTSLLAAEPLLRISSHLKDTMQTECLQGKSTCFMMSWFPIPRETILNQAQLIMR